MRRDELIEGILAEADAIRALGATALYIFGSRARDEARDDSDLDAYVDVAPERFGLVELVRLEDLLKSALQIEVQLSTRDALHPRLRARIEREAVRVL
ncbi:hypothetical protein ABB55_20410 [Prosthecomicrobium hirschii]|uniref:Polymerase nucleotidyl transferase domain-containing protein n=1 Tax=Prosthecodimorpha hirschii TaxID=665126 RepID=A0A0P6W6T5_9HYPH|nr:nucleotidyltransferase domain-containing protein [Prosthecomicrobium hirschii]KPL54285.1 hypothetical protein ABB55_20410 [Prosthecomicrobium hirschii]